MCICCVGCCADVGGRCRAQLVCRARCGCVVVLPCACRVTCVCVRVCATACVARGKLAQHTRATPPTCRRQGAGAGRLLQVRQHVREAKAGEGVVSLGQARLHAACVRTHAAAMPATAAVHAYELPARMHVGVSSMVAAGGPLLQPACASDGHAGCLTPRACLSGVHGACLCVCMQPLLSRTSFASMRNSSIW